MRRVLVPLDGSRSGNAAIDYIIGRRKELGEAAIHLLNVQPPVVAGKLAHVLPTEMIAELRRVAGEKVLRPARASLNANGIDCTARVLLGDPAETIVDYAACQGCTSIVMGTKGRSAIGNLVLGSVAARVVNRASVPVTLIKQPSEAFAKMAGNAPHLVLVGEAGASKLAPRATQLARRCPRTGARAVPACRRAPAFFARQSGGSSFLHRPAAMPVRL
jgi:nucleotide-binding universal stress UspA family protein